MTDTDIEQATKAVWGLWAEVVGKAVKAEGAAKAATAAVREAWDVTLAVAAVDAARAKACPPDVAGTERTTARNV